MENINVTLSEERVMCIKTDLMVCTTSELASAQEGASMQVEVVTGDLLNQPVEVIVNAWNRNVIPWWLLIPQGVAGAIRRQAGVEPFKELATHGPIPLGGAVLTDAGRLPFKKIIHVAGINLLWRSSKASVVASVQNAMAIAKEHRFKSVAMPLIGAGTGGGSADEIQTLILETLQEVSFEGVVYLVRYDR